MARTRGNNGNGNGNGNRNTGRNNNGGGNVDDDDDDDDDDGGGGGGGLDADGIRRLVNATVSAQIGRKLDAAIGKAVQGALTPIQEQLAALAGGRGDDGGDDDDDHGQAPKGKRSSSNNGGGKQRDPEFIAMQKKLTALEEERRTEKAQHEARERDAMLREHLGKLGVDANRMRGAVAVLREQVKKDPETGEWVYKAQRDGYVEDVDLGKGVSEWGNSDEGKSYRAPQTVKGKGNNGGDNTQRSAAGQVNVIGTRRDGGGDGKGAKQQREALREERKSAALDKLAEATGALVGGANIDVG